MTRICWLSLFVCVLAAVAETPKVGNHYSGKPYAGRFEQRPVSDKPTYRQVNWDR